MGLFLGAILIFLSCQLALINTQSCAGSTNPLKEVRLVYSQQLLTSIPKVSLN
jgi:hypothetical protein